ncbi:MAG: hypothetical protein DLM73_06045 [Chthoniobacterales bacterium]|nr:MAG: hypothetical protein DLM73_06045 [Chthoniobacterales bacterium]
MGVLTFGSARADLQLTPKLVHYEFDGVKSELLAFSDDSKTVTYTPPRGWDYSGSSMKLILRPPVKTLAEASVTKSPLKPATIFDEETTKLLVAEALHSAPPGSTNITLTSQETNPFRIAGKDTFLVSFTYTLYGENYARSLLFLNRETDQIRFQLVCRATDFKDLQRQFQSSLCSWHNL